MIASDSDFKRIAEWGKPNQMNGFALNEAEFQESLDKCAIALQLRNHRLLADLEVCEAGQSDLAEEGNLNCAGHFAAQNEARITELHCAGRTMLDDLHNGAGAEPKGTQPRALAGMRSHFLDHSRLALAQVAQGEAFGAAKIGGGH